MEDDEKRLSYHVPSSVPSFVLSFVPSEVPSLVPTCCGISSLPSRDDRAGCGYSCYYLYYYLRCFLQVQGDSGRRDWAPQDRRIVLTRWCCFLVLVFF